LQKDVRTPADTIAQSERAQPVVWSSATTTTQAQNKGIADGWPVDFLKIRNDLFSLSFNKLRKS
jgi:hypothetical protein